MPDVGVHRKGEVDLPSLLRRLRAGLGGEVGAIGCFIGVVRGVSSEGERVKFLSYEAAEDVAKKLEEIATEIETRPNIERVMIHHVVDQIAPGEDAVYVLVAGRGRREVFDALPEVMDKIKAEAPIWKKEVTGRRGRWAHQLPHDK